MLLDKLFASDPVSDLRDPAAWLLHSFGGRTTSAGVQVNTTNALTVSAYYACIRNLSEDVGTLPIFLYRRRPDGGRDRVPRANPLNRILILNPNERMTSTVYRQAMMFSAAAWGNAYSEIVRNARGQIAALNFIHPSRVSVRRELGEVWYEVTGDINGVAVRTRLEQEEMLHIKGPSEDGIIGLTMIQLVAQTVGVALAEQDFNGEVFANGAVVSGVLTHPKTLGKETHERLRDSWKQYTGRGNRNKPLVLEEDMKWVQMGIPPRDAQFIESRNFTVSELARWFRMPPHKIMHLEDATYSNIESQDRQYVTDTLMPWMLRIEQEMDFKLLTEGELARGLFIKHDAKGRLRGDTTARAAFYRTMFNMGALSPNEIRALEEMNPIQEAEGDDHYLQINLAPITALPGEEEQQGGEEEDPDPPEPPVPPQEDEDDSDEGEDDTQALAILVSDAVERVVRRSSKLKKPDVNDQIGHLRNALNPVLLAFGRTIPLDFYTALASDDFTAVAPLYKMIMENLEDDS